MNISLRDGGTPEVISAMTSQVELSADAAWRELDNPDIRLRVAAQHIGSRGWKVVPLAQLMIIASHLIRLAGRILEPPQDCKLATSKGNATAARAGIKVDNRARASRADELKKRKSQENLAVDISARAGLNGNIAIKRQT